MSELEDGKRFSEVVKMAKSLGYTEPGFKNIIFGYPVITVFICVDLSLALFVKQYSKTKFSSVKL